MGLFSKEKKYTPDEILDMINSLPEDQRTSLKAKFDDLYKAEDEREIDKIEEVKTDDAETADEKAEEVKEESEEIGKDVDEIEETGTEDEEKAEEAEKGEEDEKSEEAEAPEADPVAEDNTAEIIKGLTDKVNSLEVLVSELHELKKAMDDYVGKHKESFGYSGNATGAKKSYDDMSAEELKKEILYH